MIRFSHGSFSFCDKIPNLPLGEGARPGGRMRGGSKSVLRTAPHPSGPLALPPSPRRGFSEPLRGGRGVQSSGISFRRLAAVLASLRLFTSSFSRIWLDVGLHRGQLDVHHLGNLAVALVRADQAQDLLLRGGQHIVFRQPGLQKQGVDWRLAAGPRPGAACTICRWPSRRAPPAGAEWPRRRR